MRRDTYVLYKKLPVDEEDGHPYSYYFECEDGTIFSMYNIYDLAAVIISNDNGIRLGRGDVIETLEGRVMIIPFEKDKKPYFSGKDLSKGFSQRVKSVEESNKRFKRVSLEDGEVECFTDLIYSFITRRKRNKVKLPKCLN
ncbi:MAG: hypothetical protein Q7S56_01805 [Nanoarchaeota archaeon]|nr:hypothetical protein [Nanoarchaeota archaeon]